MLSVCFYKDLLFYFIFSGVEDHHSPDPPGDPAAAPARPGAPAQEEDPQAPRLYGSQDHSGEYNLRLFKEKKISQM